MEDNDISSNLFKNKRLVQDGGVEGCALISCESSEIAASEQPSTAGGRWNPPKKTAHVQRQRRSHNKTVGRGQSHLKSNLIPTKDSWRAQTKPCVHQDRGRGAVTPQETGQTCPCVCGTLWWGVGRQRGVRALATAVLGGSVCRQKSF